MPLTEAQVAYLGTRHRQSSHFAKGADEQFAPRALVSYYYQGRAGKKRDTGERTDAQPDPPQTSVGLARLLLYVTSTSTSSTVALTSLGTAPPWRRM